MQAFSQNVSSRYQKIQMNHVRPCLLSQVSIITTKANAIQHAQQTFKAEQKEKENNHFLLAMQSKKISKETKVNSQRQPFKNLTNQAIFQNKQQQLHQQFIEECMFRQKKQLKISYLRFQNEKTKKIHEFKCYDEADLNIPAKWQQSQIDNDCTTDDDQIQSAIKTLYTSLENAVKQYTEKNNEDNEKKNSKSFSI